jgi:5'-AMP-activated protein kinase catalytic alpha subunit
MIKRVGVYELGEVLGEGAYGIVRIAKHTESGKMFAIKILDKRKIKQDNLIENLRSEIRIMKSINHPNIVRLYEVLQSNSKIYLVIELVAEGDLFKTVKEQGAMSEDKARKIFQQIISAVSFCDRLHIAHRDLKLENILLDAEGSVKISDFGLSGLYSFEMENLIFMETICGTIHYSAPEVFSSIGYDGHVADIWSCGIILYATLTGTLPFNEEAMPELIEHIASGRYAMPSNISRGAQSLLSELLNTDPRTRISIGKIKTHPWFTIDYYEPEGIFIEEELQMRVVESALDFVESFTEVRPRKMSGFDVIHFCSGNMISRMFDREVELYNHHFCSASPLEELLQAVVSQVTALRYSCETGESRFKLLFSSESIPKLEFSVEFFELLPTLHLVNFSKVKGELQHLNQVFAEVKRQLRRHVASHG